MERSATSNMTYQFIPSRISTRAMPRRSTTTAWKNGPNFSATTAATASPPRKTSRKGLPIGLDVCDLARDVARPRQGVASGQYLRGAALSPCAGRAAHRGERAATSPGAHQLHGGAHHAHRRDHVVRDRHVRRPCRVRRHARRSSPKRPSSSTAGRSTRCWRFRCDRQAPRRGLRTKRAAGGEPEPTSVCLPVDADGGAVGV